MHVVTTCNTSCASTRSPDVVQGGYGVHGVLHDITLHHHSTPPAQKGSEKGSKRGRGEGVPLPLHPKWDPKWDP